ncbi:MAG: CvpA family protein [Anaerolineales bacterium]|nr:CvpA family protein [Anaerolineales bacterium]
MISLETLLWVLIAVFAFVGFLRGWSKEVLVTFSLILAIFVITVFLQYIPFMGPFLEQGGPARQFTARAVILIVFAFFGYQSPKLRQISEVVMRQRFEDSLLGGLAGGINGYFLFGSLLYYLNVANYPFDWVTAPGSELLTMMAYMPPAFLGVPAIYFAVAVAFTFVMVVVI